MKIKMKVLLAAGLIGLAGCAGNGKEVPAAIEPTVVTELVPTVQPTAAVESVAATELPPTATAVPRPTPTIEEAPETMGVANANVAFVRAVLTDSEKWTFHVTVEHPDTGWEDYADGWDVLLPDGTVVKPDENSPFTRLLLHPHVGEQPFTRSQSGVAIPADVTQVTVRAHDLVDGFGGQEVVVDLTAVSGPDFTVER